MAGSGTEPHRPDASRATRGQHEVYERLHSTEEFRDLRRRYRGFAIPWTVAFLVWYLLYVVMSNWAGGVMGAKGIGNINVALGFGLLQFVSTFQDRKSTRLNSRHANISYAVFCLKKKKRIEYGRR